MGKSAQVAALTAANKNQAKARTLAQKNAPKKPARVEPENWQVWAGQRCCRAPSKARSEVLWRLDRLQAEVMRGADTYELRQAAMTAEDRGLISPREAYAYRVAYTSDFWTRVENYVLDPKKENVVRSVWFDETYLDGQPAIRLGTQICGPQTEGTFTRRLSDGSSVACFHPADRLVFAGRDDGASIALFERVGLTTQFQPTFYVGYSVSR